jgi:hypothetical protein
MAAFCAVRCAEVKRLVGVCVPVKSSALLALPLKGVPLCAGGTIRAGGFSTAAAAKNGEYLIRIVVKKFTRHCASETGRHKK